MPRDPLTERYDAFCTDAEQLLKQAGMDDPANPKAQISAKAFYELSLNLARLHFPEDEEGGRATGPSGLIWRLAFVVHDQAENEMCKLLSVAHMLRMIMEHCPPPYRETQTSKRGSRPALEPCPFYESSRHYSPEPHLVFVLMPLEALWSERIWHDHIRKSLVNHVIVRRADDMFGQGVMEDVFEGIVRAQLVIADCIGRNPNVLYELGLAHALGRRTALLSQSADDIPFDLRRFRFCIYEDNSTGYPALKRFLQKTWSDVANAS